MLQLLCVAKIGKCWHVKICEIVALYFHFIYFLNICRQVVSLNLANKANIINKVIGITTDVLKILVALDENKRGQFYQISFKNITLNRSVNYFTNLL